MLEGIRKSGMNGSPNGAGGTRLGAEYVDQAVDGGDGRFDEAEVDAEALARAPERRVFMWVIETEEILMAPGYVKKVTTIRRIDESSTSKAEKRTA